MARLVEKLIRSHALHLSIAEADFSMPEALMCKNRMEHLEYLFSLVPKEGLLLDFGVYSGKAINHMAGLITDRVIHGFDSFEEFVQTSNLRCTYISYAREQVSIRVDAI